jgi:hypothetical protein
MILPKDVYLKGGSMEYAERFWGKVDKSAGEDNCWPWIGAKRTDGYGVVKIKNTLQKAHRVAWSISHPGESLTWLTHSDGQVVDHLCGNKGCCNPLHLEAVTQSVNAIRYQRSRFTGLCNNGHAVEFGKQCKQCNHDNAIRWREHNREAYNAISKRSYYKNKELS